MWFADLYPGEKEINQCPKNLLKTTLVPQGWLIICPPKAAVFPELPRVDKQLWAMLLLNVRMIVFLLDAV